MGVAQPVSVIFTKKSSMKFSFPITARQLAFAALLGCSGLLTTACSDDSTQTTPDNSAADEATIKAYLTANNITTAQRQPSGLYYVPVLTNPTGVQATAGKTVSVLYTGLLMNGSVFDASSRNGNEPFPFVLGTGYVIAGWDQGIALMRKGEKGTLLIPSALGYGNRNMGTIPPNSVLRFEVELVDVK
jgi:FKBP-type peptidyl-prolyl cis-trans isomerase